MATENVRELTARQCRDIIETPTKHRPTELLYFAMGKKSSHIVAVSRDGRTEFGTWSLELRDADMFLRVVIGETMYVEVLPESQPLRWDRAMAGLESWAKAVNGLELERVLSGRPEFAHLTSGHLMAISDYSPLGGGSSW